jgi:neutral amino acid transport system ATP-binding protein
LSSGDERPILNVDDVHKYFGGLKAVNGASFEVMPSSITALIGPNGAGKTTLFHVVSGFHRADSGSIHFMGEPIEDKGPHRIAANGLVRTFQITKALTRMTVLENMMLAAPHQPGEKLWRVYARPRDVRARERAVRDRAFELLRLVKLDSLANDYAGTLSGGQRKLLEFARALMVEPRMIMLDEPMAGVNPTLGLQLLEYIEQLRRERGITFLFVEHDMEVVMTASDRVIVMNEGAVIASGPPDLVRTSQAVIDAYLGSSAPEEAE